VLRIFESAKIYEAKRKEWFILMLDRLSLILVIIGALNWGSIGIFQFDVISWLFGGQGAAVSRVIYTLVALAGIWCISLFFKERDELIEREVDHH